MALTKGSQTTLDEWALQTNADTTAVRLGTALDVRTAYQCTLNIKAALTEAVASTGTPEIIIQVSGEGTPAKDDWTTYMRLVGPAGTPVTDTLNATEPAGETVLAVVDPATSNVDNDPKFKFLLHTTVANSEVVYQISNTADAGDTITILDGLANEQDTNTQIWDIDSATVEAVGQWTVTIDCMSLAWIRVIYNADYDADGPNLHTSCAYTLNTGI